MKLGTTNRPSIEFKEVFELYYSRLVLFANKLLNDRHTSEDCVVDAFNALWKSIENFECREQIKSFLYTTVRNKCLNIIRHNNKLSAVDIDHIHNMEDESYVEFSVIDSELHAILLKAIGELSEDARKVIEMNVFEKIKLHEIATKMDLSLNQVKALKTKAIRELKKSLGYKFLIINILL